MASFEVQVKSDKRWILEGVCEDEQEALRVAASLLAARRFAAVKVIKETKGPSGRSTEKVIFEERCPPRPEKQLTISPLAEAPEPCRTAGDLARPPARAILNRLLRRYLDAAGLLPGELIFSYHALKRFMDHEAALYPSAVDRVATLQAPLLEVEVKARRDELFRLVEEAGFKARDAEREKLMRKATLDNPAKLIAAADRLSMPGELRDLYVQTAIARDLMGRRGWLGKLEALVGALEVELADHDRCLIDAFVADALGVPELIQDLLGPRPNLAMAMHALLDLMQGRPDPRMRGDSELGEALRRRLSSGELPLAQAAILERVVREVGGEQPLARNDPSREEDSFADLVVRLTEGGRFLGGPPMAEALTQRCALRYREGGLVGWTAALRSLALQLRDPLLRMDYLLILAEGPRGAQARGEIHATLSDLILACQTVADFLPRPMPVLEVLERLSNLQRCLEASSLGDELTRPLVEHIDGLLTDFLGRKGIMEGLDDPTRPLHERAGMLVSFCAEGPLLEGRALALARQRVVELLRQPDFVEAFTANFESPAAKQEALVSFYKTLTAAGLKAG
ncbi:hypothetical protein [Roseospirillum parvum]|uniref:Uncharacterized protein n=1 Tax=Roseospirillum parvum TaxID=83401 RepID=A0A1G7ZV03_9PROT|nr:hypothetical protein [Roseospirillum parvum]SDH12474.1 hypothetical protein SAMN05421742_104228 [Roseospirillum parvum]